MYSPVQVLIENVGFFLLIGSRCLCPTEGWVVECLIHRTLLLSELVPCSECSKVRCKEKKKGKKEEWWQQNDEILWEGKKDGSLDIPLKFLLCLRSVWKCVLAAGSKTINLFRSRLCTAILASSLLHSLLLVFLLLTKCTLYVHSWILSGCISAGVDWKTASGYEVVIKAQVIPVCGESVGHLSLCCRRGLTSQFQHDWGRYFSICGEWVKSVTRVLLLASKNCFTLQLDEIVFKSPFYTSCRNLSIDACQIILLETLCAQQNFAVAEGFLVVLSKLITWILYIQGSGCFSKLWSAVLQ